MNQTVLSLVVGLLGATIGVVATIFFADVRGTSDANGYETAELAALAARLDSLEAREGSAANTPALRGATAPEGSPGSGRSYAEMDALFAQFEERMQPSVDARVEATVAKAMSEARDAEAAASKRTAKKKVTLAEAAAEIGLSAEEEDSVRRIAKETTSGFLKILAGKDGNIDDVRREFEDAKRDPKKRKAVAAKYLPRVMSNFGPVMAVMMTHEQKMKGAVGAKKADRLDSEFDVSDLDPLGLEATFDF